MGGERSVDRNSLALFTGFRYMFLELMQRIWSLVSLNLTRV